MKIEDNFDPLDNLHDDLSNEISQLAIIESDRHNGAKDVHSQLQRPPKLTQNQLKFMSYVSNASNSPI